MAPYIEPWMLCPALGRERLILIGRTIRDVRAQVALEMRPDLGDRPWNGGCTAYIRSCFALESLQSSGEHPWLTVQVNNLSCGIFIGGTSVTFYRGDEDHPHKRAMQRALGAKYQPDLPHFAESGAREAPIVDGIWLLAIVPDADGVSVLRIVALLVDGSGAVHSQWEIPMDVAFASLGVVSAIERPPVDLPPPSVSGKVADLKRPEDPVDEEEVASALEPRMAGDDHDSNQ
jgi:hypothetical protein